MRVGLLMQGCYQLAVQLSDTLPLVLMVLIVWQERLVACWVEPKSLSICFCCWRRTCSANSTVGPSSGHSNLLLLGILLLPELRLEVIRESLTKQFRCLVVFPYYVVPATRSLVLVYYLYVSFGFHGLFLQTTRIGAKTLAQLGD